VDYFVDCINLLHDHWEGDYTRFEHSKAVHDEISHIIRELELFSSLKFCISLACLRHIIEYTLNDPPNSFNVLNTIEPS
jgi:hypothetical protein